MKRNIKIIITSCIAVVGVAASIGGAFALYKKNSNPAEFSIGTYTHSSTGTISYVVGDATDNLGSDKINPDHPNVTIKAPLGGYYSNDVPAQDYVYGNLSVKATIPSSLVNKVKWSVYIGGYASNSYWGNWGNGLRKLTTDVEDSDPYLAATETTVNKDVAVKAVANPGLPEGEVDPVTSVTTWANQWVEIYLNFADAVSASNFLSTAGAGFRLDVTFAALSEGAEVPLIHGDHNGWSKDSFEYNMVPNIDETFWQWQFKNLEGCSKMVIYYKKTVDTTPVEYYIKAADGSDVSLDKTATYQVYYDGSTDDETRLYVNEDTHIVYDQNDA